MGISEELQKIQGEQILVRWNSRILGKLNWVGYLIPSVSLEWQLSSMWCWLITLYLKNKVHCKLYNNLWICEHVTNILNQFFNIGKKLWS